MAIVDCYNCGNLPELRDGCYWCNGKGRIMDTGQRQTSAFIERYPVQIVVPTKHGDHAALVALANDGTVWALANREWLRIADLPQPQHAASAEHDDQATVIESAAEQVFPHGHQGRVDRVCNLCGHAAHHPVHTGG